MVVVAAVPTIRASEPVGPEPSILSDRAALAIPAQFEGVQSLRVKVPGVAALRSGVQPSTPRQVGVGLTATVAGDCSAPVVAAHTDATFEGGSYTIQAGFAEDEVAAVVFDVPEGEFPIQVTLMECIFAQQSAIVETTTQWSVLIYDGPPDTGIVVATFSSNGEDLPHIVMGPGTQATNLSVEVDPLDPLQIYVYNDSGTGQFSVGFRIDEHNSQTQDPCFFPPPSNRNAFPTTDVSGLAQPNGNWLSAVNCGPFGCPAGWNPFSELGICTPSGDWVIRVTYNCTPDLQIGACCLGDASCLDSADNLTCDQLEGTFMGDGTLCADVTCPEPTGACCLGTTCLSAVTEPNCGAINGTYIGHGSTCASAPCDAGACCYPDGGCEDLIEATCNAQGGTFEGGSTSCATFECPQPTGACCIFGVCIPGQTEDVCNDVGEWQGAGIECDPDPCVDVPPPQLVSSDPPDGAIDARQPHAVASTTPPQGYSQVQVCFDSEIFGSDGQAVGPDDFSTEVTTSGGTSPGPAVTGVTDVGGFCYDITLESAIAPQAWTTLIANVQGADGDPIEPSADRSDVGFLPGDVNGDRTTAASDVLALIDHLNGVTSLPHYSTDIDRSDVTAAPDVLREIDLLNGAGEFNPWVGQTIPAQP